MTLDDLRIKIDRIDSQIKDLFLQRMKAAEEVAESKSKTGDKILKPEREEEVIKRLTGDMDGEMKLAYSTFLKKVMEVSRTFQYRKMLELGADFTIAFLEEESPVEWISYQGLPGSYSEMAAGSLFLNAARIPVDTFEGVFLSISGGGAQAGVVPLENTTAGSVYEVYDLLLSHDLYINASHIVKVSHCLAAVPGAGMEGIREVYSHPQALLQSAEFLKRHGLTAKTSSNTAVAAKEVAELNDKSIGAICSREAAERYGLIILQEGVNHNKENATKFVSVSKQLIVKEDHDKIAVVFACPHRSGSLAAVLGIFGDYGVNLTEIHSRPDGKNPWEYLFYVDFTGNLKDGRIRALLYQLHEELPFVKIIGSYESKNQQ
ncbi:MAG TPA: prephenate dehydratase domain-containing protein [Anaerovoracaceae bacterium]|nr:prephenate dehydratase domain-containing protein [Anaerovoracaceae bacterium]